jgi:predicted HicB family RNase H-like nuclease
MKRQTRPGRPKVLKDPTTLNLSIDAEVKRKAFAMATDQNKSISALIAGLIREASEITKAA